MGSLQPLSVLRRNIFTLKLTNRNFAACILLGSVFFFAYVIHLLRQLLCFLCLGPCRRDALMLKEGGDEIAEERSSDERTCVVMYDVALSRRPWCDGQWEWRGLSEVHERATCAGRPSPLGSYGLGIESIPWARHSTTLSFPTVFTISVRRCHFLPKGGPNTCEKQHLVDLRRNGPSPPAWSVTSTSTTQSCPTNTHLQLGGFTLTTTPSSTSQSPSTPGSRVHQAALLHQQSLILNNIVEPLPAITTAREPGS